MIQSRRTQLELLAEPGTVPSALSTQPTGNGREQLFQHFVLLLDHLLVGQCWTCDTECSAAVRTKYACCWIREG